MLHINHKILAGRVQFHKPYVKLKKCKETLMHLRSQCSSTTLYYYAMSIFQLVLTFCIAQYV